MLEIPGVHCGNSVDLMEEVSDGLIKLTVVSPPYGKLRSYNGYDFDFDKIAEGLWRVTMDGGVLVWVVADALVKGSETCNSFRQVLKFRELGFNLHDTMIYCKQNPIPRNQRRYTPQFEFMFVFSKGDPLVFNPIKEKCKYAGVKSTGKYFETPDTEVPYRGSGKKEKRIAEEKVKGNVWTYWVGRDTSEEKKSKKKGKDGKDKFYHPAKMHLQLARDHILSWSDEGDLVFDPMCGSGTTLVAAHELKRKYLGIDISEEYVEKTKLRLKELIDESKSSSVSQPPSNEC
jgi:site-specific DNA-methyltransferase (adenine-specific)